MDDPKHTWLVQRREADLHAIRDRVSIEEPPRPAWMFEVDLGPDADQCAERIRAVTTTVLDALGDAWPTDEEWERRLPSWFLERTPRISREQADAWLRAVPRAEWGQLPWDYGSWLDAMRGREWRWWSAGRRDGRMVIYLQLDGWPAMLEAYEHLLRAAGATILRSEGLWQPKPEW